MNTIYKYIASAPDGQAVKTLSLIKQNKYEEPSTSGKKSPPFPFALLEGFFIVIQEFILDKQTKSF